MTTSHNTRRVDMNRFEGTVVASREDLGWSEDTWPAYVKVPGVGVFALAGVDGELWVHIKREGGRKVSIPLANLIALARLATLPRGLS